MQIEDFLYQKNLYQPLSGKQPEGMKDEDWALLDRQASSYPTDVVPKCCFQHSKGKDHGRSYGSSLQYTVGMLLLPAVSSSSGNSKLKFDDVRDLVLSEEIRRRESVKHQPPQPCTRESRGRTSERNSNRGRSKSSGKNPERKKDFTCYNCGKKGHFKRDCRALKKDTGASFHSTPCQEIMENYISGDFGKVHLADDETLKIVGKGDIRLKLPNQTTWKLTGVRHIPGLKRNLISVGQLDGEGYSTTFSVADADGKSNLWHQRLGHMSEKGMKILLSKGSCRSKNVMSDYARTASLENKRKSVCKDWQGTKAERLELIHMMYGTIPVPSLAGSLYYVTFIDDSTRKESTESRFRDFCANNGIKMEKTVPITPQQNGVAERMNRTLNERARSMRIHAGLPKFLWAEAINTAAYLINRGPSVPLDGGIPEEAWSKKEINLSYLRVFGCISYVHIDSAERSKLDAKSNKCVFVGYGGDEFGYRFWDYENRKIIRSRDVIFNENVMYKDRSTAESSNTEAETKEFAEFEEISENDVQISPEAVQEEEPGTPELRRSSRIPKQPNAMQVEDSVKWESSMKDEMDSLMSNQTWELAELPQGKKALHNKWIYRIKEEHDGSKRYKARLVVKAFSKRRNLYEAARRLHRGRQENLVCRLKKSLYGLKQAPRQWYKKFDSFMGSSGFTRCQADHCCYIKRFDNSFIILLLYVDDMLVAGSDMQEILHLKQKLSKQFAMKDLGAAKQILGMRIKRDTKSETLMLSQAEYINKVLSRFNMQDAKPVSTPLGVHFRLSKEQSPKTEEERAHMVKVPYASAIGSLMYAMVCTRPDIAQAVGAVSRWRTILTGYVDADLAGNVDIRRSTTGYVYTLGGTAVSWVSQLQKIVALSTTEAEYVAVTEASKEMVWLQSFLNEEITCTWVYFLTTITATNFCPPNYALPSDDGGWCNPPRQHFDMSQPAFETIAIYRAGIVPILYRKVRCRRSGGIRFTVNGRDYFELVLVSNVGGAGDISMVWIKGSKTNKWETMSRNWGANWQSFSYLNDQSLSFRVQVSNGRIRTAFNVMPSNWQFGQSFRSKVQF
ncbi:Expansin-A8 [Hibiscus syriacus]|uniref:Expansin-A8 n=1 Tax=Hibiscus syriacus TaxID=106335 RepID=A0A6A2Z0H7_HIBSY|nr:Expansin-A8 [Hibiscus syriacus]